MLEQAFNSLFVLHSRPATLRRLGSPNVDRSCRIMPSNYFRFLEGPSHTVSRGREFIISVKSIINPLTPMIKRGDRVVDEIYGSLSIDEIIEMVDIGGAVMAFRVRTE